MAMEVWANLASATVTSGGTTAPSAGTVQTWTLSGSTLPSVSSSASPPTQCYASDPAAPSEVFLITNVSGSTATVTRGADGSTPVTHAAGFTINQVYAGATLRGFQQVIPPTGDTTGAKDTAAINAVTQAGGIAQLIIGTYYITNLLPDTYGAIIGAGMGTILQAVSGTTGYMIALKTPATTKQVTLSSFTLIPNTGTLGGVQIDNTGFTPDVSYVPYDPLHSLEHIFVLGSGGDAFHFDNNAREIRVRNCVQYFAANYGFYLGPGSAADGAGCTDSHFTDCTSGASGNHGWYIADTASNNMFTSCKAFYAGFAESTGEWDTTSCGFEILGAFLTFTSCSAQQAALHGFDLNECQNVTLSGCEADTNSAGGITTGVGINVNGTTQVSVLGCTGSVNTSDPPGAAQYGIQTAGTLNSTSIIGNSLYGTVGSINRTDTGGAGNTVIDPADVQLNYPYIQTEMGMLGLTTLPGTEQYFGLLYGWDGSGGGGYAQLATKTGAGLASMLQMSQYSATSAVTVANSTAIASIGSLSVPADDPQAGARYRVTAHGTVSTEATPGAVTVDLRWGGTTGTLITSLVTATSAPAMTASLSAAPVLIEGEVEFITSTTCVGWLRLTWRPAATTAAIVALASITTAVTVTTSSTESFSLDWTWATANASNTVTIASSSFERVA